MHSSKTFKRWLLKKLHKKAEKILIIGYRKMGLLFQKSLLLKDVLQQNIKVCFLTM